jgi:hypothetical protein
MVPAIHRARTHDFEHFLYKLGNIINYFYITKAEFVSFGYINVDYLA